MRTIATKHLTTYKFYCKTSADISRKLQLRMHCWDDEMEMTVVFCDEHDLELGYWYKFDTREDYERVKYCLVQWMCDMENHVFTHEEVFMNRMYVIPQFAVGKRAVW